MEARARRGQKKSLDEANQMIQVCILIVQQTLSSKILASLSVTDLL